VQSLFAPEGLDQVDPVDDRLAAHDGRLAHWLAVLENAWQVFREVLAEIRSARSASTPSSSS
jgi:hypothetical protein